jgi:pectate lyase
MSRFTATVVCSCVLSACSGAGSSSPRHEDASIPRADVTVGGGGGNPGSGGAMGSGGALGTGGATSTSGGTAGGIAGNAAGGVTGSGGLATGGASAAAGTSGGTGTVSTGGASAGGTIGIGGAGTGGKAAGTGGAAGASADGGIGSDGPGAGGARTGGSGSGGTGTGGTPATGGSSAGSCTAPPDPSPLIGWASQSGSTTGGGSAAPTTVTTLTALQSAVKGNTAAVIYVKGVMAAGSVSIGSNKTIAGICGAEIHGHVEMSGSVNVIVRNIKIVGYGVGDCSLDPNYDSSKGCSSGQDAISLQKDAHNVWFDHCDISDGTDGNLDITNGADFVTVSWTKFHYTPRTDNGGSDSTGASGHRFSNLVGGGDGVTGDAGKLNVTWHHNWWADNVVERQPRVRFGKNHILNNLYTSTSGSYCVRAGIEAQILVENNAFIGVKNPQEFNSTTDQGTAYITSKGNLYSGTSGTQAMGGGGTPFTTPPYSYTPDSTADLEAAIRSGAGPH